MELAIDFFEGPPPMEVGGKTRFRVASVGAEARQAVPLTQVSFSFAPSEWARVLPTQDPTIGLLEVTQVQDESDPLLAPSYTIDAQLKAQARQTFQSERTIRLVPDALEIALGFEVGDGEGFARFGPEDLSHPIDWSLARVGDPRTQQLVLHDDRPYLRVSPPSALPAQVKIVFPNGELATLVVEGVLRCSSGGTPAHPRRPTQKLAAIEIQPPVAARPEPKPSPTPQPLHEELARLRRYVASFTKARPDSARAASSIQDRIEREVARVRQRIERDAGEAQAELLAQLRSISAEATSGA